MPENQDKLSSIIAIVQLATNLTPLAFGLIRQLAEQLSGKSDDEILAESDAILDQVIQRARDEKAKLAPPSS